MCMCQYCLVWRLQNGYEVKMKDMHNMNEIYVKSYVYAYEWIWEGLERFGWLEEKSTIDI